MDLPSRSLICGSVLNQKGSLWQTVSGAHKLMANPFEKCQVLLYEQQMSPAFSPFIIILPNFHFICVPIQPWPLLCLVVVW